MSHRISHSSPSGSPDETLATLSSSLLLPLLRPRDAAQNSDDQDVSIHQFESWKNKLSHAMVLIRRKTLPWRVNNTRDYIHGIEREKKLLRLSRFDGRGSRARV